MFQIWIILSLLSAISTGIKQILSKKILSNKIKSLELIFSEYLLLFIIVSLIFLPLIIFKDIIKIYDIILLKCISLFLFNLFFLKLLKRYEISLISPLNNLSPVFLILMSSVFLNEIINITQFIGIIIIIFSTYFLEVNFHHHINKNIILAHKTHFDKLKKFDYKTIGVIFLMLFSISICAILDKKILEITNVYTDLFYTSIITFIPITIYYIKKNKLKNSFKIIKQNPSILIISFFSNLATFFILTAISIPGVMISLVIPIKRTSSLFASLIGGVLFHEKHLIKKIFAIIFMLLSIFLISL